MGGGSYVGMLGISLKTSIDFLGIKLILYYGLFYAMGWFIKWGKKFFSKREERFCDFIAFICICIFATIIFNVNLYHIADNLVGISIRLAAGLTGNYIIYYVVKKYTLQFQKAKLDILGIFTLEIYATHMYTNHMFSSVAKYDFFTVLGFVTFFCSLICTIILTGIVSVVLKCIPVTNYLFYGKKSENKGI